MNPMQANITHNEMPLPEKMPLGTVANMVQLKRTYVQFAEMMFEEYRYIVSTIVR